MASLSIPILNKYNWVFRRPAETLVGSIQRISVDDWDGDINVHIIPNADYEDIFVNRFGARTPGPTITCEVCPQFAVKDKVEAWMRTMLPGKATARGVYVDDKKHEEKPELHPLDLLVGHLTETTVKPSGWILDLAQRRNLDIGRTLLAYRFAAASDHRRKWPFKHGPPLYNKTRDVDLALAFPPQPGEGWNSTLELRTEFQVNAIADVAQLGGGHGTKFFNFHVKCEADKVSAVFGDIVAYWVDPSSAEISLPQTLDFGTVQREARELTLRIENTGGDAVSISVPPPHPNSGWQWTATNQAVMPARSHRDERIVFRPSRSGTWREEWTIIYDEAVAGPRRVVLIGKRIGGNL